MKIQEIYIQIANQIEKETKLSQTEIANFSGFTRQYVNNFFRGRLNNPTLSTIVKIAEASGVELTISVERILSFTNDNVGSEANGNRYSDEFFSS